MLWICAIGFAIYALVFQAARESWLRRLKGEGAKPTKAGHPARDVARLMLARRGVESVKVVTGRGGETARFDLRGRRIVLGKGIANSHSVAAVVLAAAAVAEVLAPPEERDAMANRRFVIRFLHPGLGLLLGTALVACVFRPMLWKAVFFGWVSGGLVLLAGHAMTLAWEYKLAERALSLLEDAGLIHVSERADFASMAKAMPLREILGVGHAIRRTLGAILPVRGW